MNKIFKKIILLAVIIIIGGCTVNKETVVKSPDGKFTLAIKSESGEKTQRIASFSLKAGNREILLPS